MAILVVCGAFLAKRNVRAQEGQVPLQGIAPVQDIASLPREVVEQDGNHRVLVARDRNGNVISQYTELCSAGWRQLEDGTWADCDNEIELFNGGAIARKMSLSIIFSPSSDDPAGVFDLLLSDKQSRLRGQCVGLVFSEYANGTNAPSKSAFIADIRDVPGVVAGKNEVYYFDSFSGVKATLRYRLDGVSSFHQDVILESKLPDPRDLGMDPAVTFLEIWTEMIEAPAAVNVPVTGRTKDGIERPDCVVDFGSAQIGMGSGYPVGGTNDPGTVDLGHTLPIQKQYLQIDQMQFLIEQVPYLDVAPELQGLQGPPQATVDRDKVNRAYANLEGGSGGRSKPVAFRERTRKKEQERKRTVAMSTTPRPKLGKGYLLDYDVIWATLTDKPFYADYTYYVVGATYLQGNCVMEGGTCFKFANTNSAQLIVSSGTLNMLGDMYKPVLMLAKDDSSAGAVIFGASGSPSGTYATVALSYQSSVPANIHNLRIRHAAQAISFGNNLGVNPCTIAHCAISDCGTAIGIANGNLNLRNALIYNCTRAFASTSANHYGENVTFDQLTYFNQDPIGCTYTFTNSIFCNAGTLPSMNTGYNVTNNTASAVFQEVGASKHYLNDSYRNLGTSGINPALLSDLKLRTTYGPIVLSNVTLNTPKTFFPVVPRDTDTIDPGYHADPIDWALSGVTFTNAAVTVLPGTVLACFQNGTTTIGLTLGTNATLRCSGTADVPVRFTHYSCVQEQASTNWIKNPRNPLTSVYAGPGTASLSFAEFYAVASEGSIVNEHIWLNPNCAVACAGTDVTTAINCRFFDGGLEASYTPLQATNCLFDSSYVQGWSAPNTKFLNCTFHRGTFTPYLGDQYGLYYITNCLFEETVIYQHTNVFGDYNAYESGYGRLAPNGSNDVILSSAMTYGKGLYGSYYQTATNLVDRGNTSATNVGLYHFTAQGSEAKEATSTVDIGFHVPATTSTRTVPSTARVGWWKLDDGSGTSAVDSSGNGNTGTLTSGPTWTAGEFSNAVSFDGVNDYIQVGAASALAMSGSVTMSAWVYPVGTAGGIIMNKEGEYECAVQSGTLQWAMTSGGVTNWGWLDTGFVVPGNQWTHLVVAYGSGFVSTYANGVLVHSYPRTTTIGDVDSSKNDFRIGGRQAISQYFSGKIDDVVIYNQMLSASDVANMVSRVVADSDSDGVADYLEDANGNGVVDSGETNWNSATDVGFKVLITQPDGRFNIP